MKILLNLLVVLVICLPLSFARAAVVVEYHHVSEKTPKSTSITPAQFKAHLDYLSAQQFNVVALEFLVDKLRKGEPLPDKTIAITFDDAYISVYETALPLLKTKGWPFTVFVNSNSVGQSSLFMNWAQLKAMAAQGVTIANHSRSHAHLVRRLKGEAEADWRLRITQDILAAQTSLQQHIGRAPKIFAYPYGEYDVPTRALLKQLGYVAFGQQSGPLPTSGDLQALPRFPFGGFFTELDDFALKVNSLPLELNEVAFAKSDGAALANLIVAAGSSPQLIIEPKNTELLTSIQCFATGQGAAHLSVSGKRISVKAKQPLQAGRVRFNCTAPAPEKGRFYWYAHQWLVTDEKGNWSYND